MLGWLEKYRAEGVDFRHYQILDHFAPDSRPKSEVQFYARMVNELTNLSTLESIIAMNEALAIPDPEELFAAITSPTIIISGTRDRNHKKAFDLVPRIKGSEIFSIENAGHSMIMQANIDQLHDLGIVPATFDVASYADLSYVDEAAARSAK
jgi:pimeloyl-ACP methyl ester carboxylesterase